MRTARYKGFQIVARPYQLSACQRWTVDLEIRRSGRCQSFSTSGRYRTEHEAAAHCYCLAHRIIDGADPRWSVDYLRGARRNGRRLTRTWMDATLRPLLVAGLVFLVVGTFFLLRGARGPSALDVRDVNAAEVTGLSGPMIPSLAGGTVPAPAAVLPAAGGQDQDRPGQAPATRAR